MMTLRRTLRVHLSVEDSYEMQPLYVSLHGKANLSHAMHYKKPYAITLPFSEAA